jgi:pyruvate kinase
MGKTPKVTKAPVQADPAALAREVAELQAELAAQEPAGFLLAELPEDHRVSARNLEQYVELRRRDLRPLQARLAELGLSSLGRAEDHVQANLEAVKRALDALSGAPAAAPAPVDGGPEPGPALLERRARRLLGPEVPGRAVRIMVTMPSEAATDPRITSRLVAAGMQVMRINCAHDNPDAWEAMLAHLHAAEEEQGRRCRVLMDLPGPKLRTGPVTPGPAVVRCHARKDLRGDVVVPASLRLVVEGQPASASPVTTVPVEADWLASARVGDRLRFRDRRGRRREMVVRQVAPGEVWVTGDRTAYLEEGIELRLRPGPGRRSGRKTQRTRVGALPPIPGAIRLQIGDRLLLTAPDIPGIEATRGPTGEVVSPARIGCTYPEVLPRVRVGEMVLLDDGKFRTRALRHFPGGLEVEVVGAPPGGARLRAEKGVNFPETETDLPCLTPFDREALRFVVAHADMVGLSFVRQVTDLDDLEEALREHGDHRLGVVLKVETGQAFAQLPELLLGLLRFPRAGVMIARGDLAVETSFERLAELQEEILWLAQAAHLPVIWATQVLDSMAKDGLPTRAEVTDAAMGERAECVMLNKGPYVVEAVRTLDDILRRMQTHQRKKTPTLRALAVANASRLGHRGAGGSTH